jgi:hypothetical protein
VVENITPSFVVSSRMNRVIACRALTRVLAQSSKMSKIRGTSWTVPSAKTFARASLNALGTKFNTGYFAHDLMMYVWTL